MGIINHLPRRLPFADRVTVFSESGCGFQSEGMDGYIRRRERDDSVNGFFEALERIAGESRDKIDIYKIDTEQEQELAAAFGIRSIPTLLFVPMEGKPQMVQGAIGKADFEKIIQEVLLAK